MKDYQINSDIDYIDARIKDLKPDGGVSVSAALAELFQAKALLVSAKIALEATAKYEELMKKEGV